MTNTMTRTMTISDAFGTLLREPLRVRFTAYDGSSTGDQASPYGLHLRNERGLSYLLTAPGELGMMRAYVSGDLQVDGVHPGDPYPVVALLMSRLELRRPGVVEGLRLLRALGMSHLRPPEPPAVERVPRWRRTTEGLLHTRNRDAEAIHHHYDVSNEFYRQLLGPSMTYTCAVYPSRNASLEEAQDEKYDLIARKLGLRSGDRLLDVGCGWGGMVRFAAREYGVQVLGVTLAREQASWAQHAIEEQGLGKLAQVRHLDYRDVSETGFDAVSSIGMLEHIGVRNYPAYFMFLRDRLRPGGRLLNHCITRPHNRLQPTGPVIDRYVFPDAELTGVGRITTEAQAAGLEVQHVENLREHYALTLEAWTANLVENWEACVQDAGEEIARVWGIYLAGSRIAFERNDLQLHHVLASRTDEHGTPAFPLRPNW
jgi:cyclopropane-fatty-acyl-phospholipid synthase